MAVLFRLGMQDDFPHPMGSAVQQQCLDHVPVAPGVDPGHGGLVVAVDTHLHCDVLPQEALRRIDAELAQFRCTGDQQVFTVLQPGQVDQRLQTLA
ncbi:hypothetical protein D3C81_1080030 [compost metagenome]